MAQTLSAAGSPAHHRYPVWWTGDGVPLMASVESMVNEAVHDFRAFVHSDCGGHGTNGDCPGGGLPSENQPCPSPNDAALLRWTAHCVLGTVVRFHQGDHRFWLRANATQDTARSYLNMRYKLAPSLIAAGRILQQQGFPLTARCDLLWPEHLEARDSTQYVHLNATLVAPLDVEPVDNVTNTRSVWIPPGEWVDGWSGVTVEGPKNISVTQPANRIPMWHKRGSVLVTDGTKDNLRIVNQDWTELTIEAFPTAVASSEHREVFEQDNSEYAGAPHSTVVSLSTFGNGTVVVAMSASPVRRCWVVRLHLHHVGQRISVDPVTVVAASIVGPIRHLLAKDCSQAHFPFGGAGVRPACHAGPIAEFRLAATTAPRRIEATLIDGVL